MQRLTSFLLLLVSALAGCSRFETTDRTSAAAKPQPGTFFVATNGNDQWSGTIPSNRGKKNGPFRTMQRALAAAAELKQQQGGRWQHPVSIYIRGGTHWLDEPIVLSPLQSGSGNAGLVIAAYHGEKPVLSAGRPISNWRAVTVNGKQLWAASVPECRDSGWFFHQLWVNGERRVRARHPNSGCFKIAGLPDATPTWEHGQKRLQFIAGDLADWKSATDGEAVVMTRWVESRLPITGIDIQQRILSSSNRTVFQMQPGDPFYVEHVFEVLDEPGEWFLDRKSGTLYYQPKPGETLETFHAIAPRLMECMRFDGQPEQNQYVENIRLRGITFSYNEWYYPTNFGSTERHISSTPDPEIFGSSQAAFIVPGAVRAEGARNCSFENCVFSNIGSYGLQLGRGCHSNRVAACNFTDLAAGGIRIGETILRTNALEQAHDNEVSDCRISDGGKVFHSGEGIWIGQSFGNHLTHNLLHDFFYTGISIGWTWGYKSSLASNNIVEFNHVHHIGRKSNGEGPILGDMGIIYLLGEQPGTVLRQNLLHDIQGLYFGWGLYFDEGASHIVAEKNVVFGTTHGAFHQHYGKENIVRNNVFAFGRDQQLQRSRAEDHSSFTLDHNIIYFDHGKLLEGDWTGGKFSQDYNLYFDTRTNVALNLPGGLENWRKSGRDLHSVVANPGFTTTNLAAFALRADSPAFALGFEPFDLKTVGPRY